MPWNKPGDEPKTPPNAWGGKPEKMPPNLDKILVDGLKKCFSWLKHSKPPSTSHFKNNNPKMSDSSSSHDIAWFFGISLLVILVLWFFSGFYIVNPAEEAVILRLGKFYDIVSPGLHWFPRAIDTKIIVDVQKIYAFSLQGDFLTKSSEKSDLPVSVAALEDNPKSPYIADQSKNLVNVELNVQYRIQKPDAYLFQLVNPDDTIQSVAGSALSDVIGQMKLDEVLTTGREALSSGVLDRMKEILASYQAGIEVVAITLRKVQAPDQVRGAFNDVNRADQDKATTIQQAEAYASQLLPLAKGEAARTLADATAYQQKVILTAQADVARYQAFLTAYHNAPDVTRERMYLETMQSLLQHTTKVLTDGHHTQPLFYLPLDSFMRHPVQSLNKKVAS